MLFNRSRKWDFQPKIEIENKQIDVVEEAKILGVIVSSDLKWKKHVDYIVKKFMKKLWMLRRIKQLGGSIEDLLCVYTVQLRCITELACPAWNGALTENDSKRLEKLQKIAFKVILGEKFASYDKALKMFKLPKLADRRKTLCTKFAIKTAKFLKYNPWFQKNKKTRNSKEYREVYSRTAIYQKSSLFYLSKLLNN